MLSPTVRSSLFFNSFNVSAQFSRHPGLLALLRVAQVPRRTKMSPAKLEVIFSLFDSIQNDWITSEKDFRVDESVPQIRNAVARGSGYLASLPQTIKDWIREQQNAPRWKCSNCRARCTLADDWATFAVASESLDSVDKNGNIGAFIMASVPYCSDKARCKDVAVRLAHEVASQSLVMLAEGAPTVKVPLNIAIMKTISGTPVRFLQATAAIPVNAYEMRTGEEAFQLLLQERSYEAARTVLHDIARFSCAVCGGEASDFAYRTFTHIHMRSLTPKDELGFEAFPTCSNPTCMEKTQKLVSDGKGAYCRLCGTRALDVRREFQRCSKCKAVTYCSRRCQEDDWPEHKQHCFPKKVRVEVEGEAVTEPHAATAEVSACGACGRAEEEGEKLLLCSGCHSDKYCDRECQRAAWKTHKVTCNPPSG